MALLERSLRVRGSVLPGAGKGLFTTQFIPKGTRIVEYKGTYKKALGRYANDGRGLYRIPGITNNAQYVEDEGKVYIEATKDIPAGSEILVSYGKEYWDVIRHNLKLEQKDKKKK